MTFDANVTACAQLVEKADPDRFSAAMASPVAARQVLFPLYAFSVEVSRAPWVTQEPMIAEMRLQWWRDALEEIATGASTRRHEVVTPLATVLNAEDASILDRLVAARRWDIYKDAFEDQAHFDRYIEDTSALLMQIAARALARQSASASRLLEEVEATLLRLGAAHGLARFLAAVPELEARGRIPLVDGRPDAIRDLAAQALEHCPTRREVKRLLPRVLWPAATEAFKAQALLLQVAAQPEKVANGRLGLHPLARSIALWRWS